ncbi:MAG: CRISPR-associated endonuclease Cas1 [Saprospiraceae bacterium]
MQLFLDSKGIQIANKNNAFHLTTEGGTRTIGAGKLTSIAIAADVVVHTSAIKLAIKNEIPILFFNRYGKVMGRLWSPHFHSIATLRRYQVHFLDSLDASAWLIDLFWLKTEQQVKNLQYLQMRQPVYASLLGKAISSIKRNSKTFEKYRDQLINESRNAFMGTEGTIARIYWQAVGNTLPRKHRFQQRSRRPAKDNFNAAINYGYGMLYSIVESGIMAVGLDPQLGLLHTDEYTKPTLSFDLIEAFRPWIDRLMIEACVEETLKADFFSKNQHGIFLNKKGKAFLIPLFNALMRKEIKWLNQEATVKNQVYYLATRLARRIRTTMEA